MIATEEVIGTHLRPQLVCFELISGDKIRNGNPQAPQGKRQDIAFSSAIGGTNHLVPAFWVINDYEPRSEAMSKLFSENVNDAVIRVTQIGEAVHAIETTHAVAIRPDDRELVLRSLREEQAALVAEISREAAQARVGNGW